MTAAVEHHPGDAARLREHRDAHARDVRELVREAVALGVGEEAPFDEQRMRDDDLLRIGEGAQALIGGHVAHRRAERFAPQDAVALVALVAEILGVRHLGDVPRHHRVVAAEAAGGEHHRPAPEMLDHAARPFDAQSEHAVVRIRVQVGDACLGHDLDAGPTAGVLQQAEQFLAVSARRDVQPRPRMPETGPLEVEQQGDTVAVGQPVEGGAGFAGDEARQRGVGAALGLGHDVCDERLRIVLDAGGTLRRRADAADRPERHRGAAPRAGIALEHQHLPARIPRGERGGEATRPRPDDGDVDAELELGDVLADDAHVAFPAGA